MSHSPQNFLDLPSDVILNIIKWLNLNDLRNMMLTCKTILNLILNDVILWKNLFKNSTLINDGGKWSFYNRCRISHNWYKGIYKQRIIIRYNELYMPWIKYQNRYLIQSTGTELSCYAMDNKGMLDTRIPQWKVNIPCEYKHASKTDDVSRFILKGDMIICGHRNGCTSIHKTKNLRNKPKLLKILINCHENDNLEVSAVEYIEKTNCLFTGSMYSNKLKFWNDILCRTDESYTVMEIPLSSIKGIKSMSLNMDENLIAIGPNGSNTPVVVDLETTKQICNIDNPINERQAVKDIQWHNSNIVACVTHSGYLRCIDIRTKDKDIVHEAMDPFQSSFYCLKTDGENAAVVGSAEYSRCVLFDLRKANSHVQMYFTQKSSSPVYSLDFDSTKLFAAVDRSVTVLNFNVSVSRTPVRDYSQKFEFVS